MAGPPCQGFSVAGPAQYGKIDNRNTLLLQVLRFVQCLKPRVCIVENVKGILHGRLPNNIKALYHFIAQMESIGYLTSIKSYKQLTLVSLNHVSEWLFLPQDQLSCPIKEISVQLIVRGKQ